WSPAKAASLPLQDALEESLRAVGPRVDGMPPNEAKPTLSGARTGLTAPRCLAIASRTAPVPNLPIGGWHRLERWVAPIGEMDAGKIAML
ncbi:MAG: hypothetical protein ACK56R_02640, partial [Pirellulaceae bacterium]